MTRRPSGEGSAWERAAEVQDYKEARVGFRKILWCDVCKRERGHELRPYVAPATESKGTVEDFRFRCKVCGTPSRESIDLTTSQGLHT